MAVTFDAVVAGVAALVWMIVLSWVDIRDRRLPNRFTMPVAAMVGLSGLVGLVRGDPAVLTGALALAGAYLAVHLLAPRAMGAGDVKLAFCTGGMTGGFGLQAWFLAAVGALALTGVIGLWLLARGHRNALIPHGPSMCAATASAVVLIHMGQ